MPEEYGIAESVTGTDASVAIDPSLLNKPVQPDAQPANGNDELLKHKLGLANQHAKKAKLEADEVRRQFESLTAEMSALKEAQQSAVRENLEGQGAFKELYDQEKSRAKQLESRLLNETAELKQQLESVTQNANNERLKSAALQQISRSNAVNPNQLYTLLQPQLRTNEEGQRSACLTSGVEHATWVTIFANLKSSGRLATSFLSDGTARESELERQRQQSHLECLILTGHAISRKP